MTPAEAILPAVALAFPVLLRALRKAKATAPQAEPPPSSSGAGKGTPYRSLPVVGPGPCACRGSELVRREGKLTLCNGRRHFPRWCNPHMEEHGPPTCSGLGACSRPAGERYCCGIEWEPPEAVQTTRAIEVTEYHGEPGTPSFRAVPVCPTCKNEGVVFSYAASEDDRRDNEPCPKCVCPTCSGRRFIRLWRPTLKGLSRKVVVACPACAGG